MLLDDELDELFGDPETKTFIWDITDLQNPELKNVHVSTQPATDHNQYILGDYTFQVGTYMKGYQGKGVNGMQKNKIYS